MNMKINSNIIKILFLVFFMGDRLQAWSALDDCQEVGCLGCTFLKPLIKRAAKVIDKRHAKLEERIAKQYEDEIINANIKKIHTIQNGITKSVARIKALEHEANMDSKHLIFLLRKNKELYTIPLVGVHE